MAKDKLFHKIRERKEKSFERRTEWRKSNNLVLIVCQGKRTEPNYLRGLQSALRINNASLKFLEYGQGKDSLTVVNAAIAEYDRDPTFYDRIYCVFDKDEDRHYTDAMQLLHAHPDVRRVIFVANSVPCFEVWLLLHFTYTTQHYARAGNRSPCDCLQSDLKKKGRIPNYEKNHKGIYNLVGDKTSTAIRNAKTLRKHNTAVRSDNPSTMMHELVTYLHSIAPK